jgi:LysR family transcriptional regulator, nitrogen assimilation regulatory protein
MDLRQLRYFVGIVQAGSLSRAANQLNVAQSAISHHLASLEAELDKQLVTRGPKGIVLTDAGTVLYRHAEAILRHVEFAKQDAMNTLMVPSGNVAIGFPTALTSLLGFELFVRVRKAYPQIRLHLVDGKSALIRELLDNGRLDLAILFAPQPERGLACEPLLLEELFFTTAGGESGPIGLAEVVKRPLILPGLGSGVMQVLQDALNQCGLTMTTVGDIDTLDTVRRAVAAGIANSILPWSALYDGDRESPIIHRRVHDAPLSRSVALCSSEVAQRSPAFEAVASLLKTMIREMVESGRWKGVSLLSAPNRPVAAAQPV